MKVRITDPKDFYCGQEFEGSIVYHDYLHGERIDGKIQDLYSVTIAGKTASYLSHQVDVEYYEKQLRAAEVERLGADIGDTVIITMGSTLSRTSTDMATSASTTTWPVFSGPRWRR